jgi:phosphate transport system permease protein
MQASTVLLTLLLLTFAGFYLGRKRSIAVVNGHKGVKHLHSLPNYYGYLVAIWCGIPALILFALWSILEPAIITHLVVAGLPENMRNLPEAQLNLVVNDIKNLVGGNIVSTDVDAQLQAAADHYKQLQSVGAMALTVVVLAIAISGTAFGLRSISPKLRARNYVEVFIKFFLVVSSTIAIFTTAGIVVSLLFEAIRFFQAVPVFDFLFGLKWSPQMAIRADQVGSSGAFGAVPLFAGTALVSLIAMFVAVLEILAGIPTVVYGFFAALTVAPFVRRAGESLGLTVSSESALAAGLVMGVMIIPFVSSLSDDVINAVPQAMRDGSLGLGATQSETIKRVIFPAALPGIVGGILLAVSRAIGETMIVVMAAGLSANLTANPLEAVTTVTVQIVTLLVGDQEFDSPKTLAAFALGLVLFIVTLVLNIIALQVVRKYREQYE